MWCIYYICVGEDATAVKVVGKNKIDEKIQCSCDFTDNEVYHCHIPYTTVSVTFYNHCINQLLPP